MKVTIAYYLFVLYAIVIFRPFIPLLSDAIAHNFLEAVHISSVHMIYGEHHAMKEVQKENAPENQSHHSVEKGTDIDAIYCANNDIEYDYLKITKVNNYCSYMLRKLLEISPKLTSPPPDFPG